MTLIAYFFCSLSPPRSRELSKNGCTHPVRDFWQISNWSSKCGSSCPMVSSPTQHWTTFGISCARVIIFTQDLSILEKRLASCRSDRVDKSMVCLRDKASHRPLTEAIIPTRICIQTAHVWCPYILFKVFLCLFHYSNLFIENKYKNMYLNPPWHFCCAK